jgi:hypothetical protein
VPFDTKNPRKVSDPMGTSCLNWTTSGTLELEIETNFRAFSHSCLGTHNVLMPYTPIIFVAHSNLETNFVSFSTEEANSVSSNAFSVGHDESSVTSFEPYFMVAIP